MNFSVKKDIINNALNIVIKAAATKGIQPVFSNVLIETLDNNEIKLCATDLDIYIERDGQKIDSIFGTQDFIVAFIDAEMKNPSALDILGKIRKYTTRRKTSVIIMAEKMDKASVVRFRDSGTNNIIVSPFSTNKILQKVFESVTLDRNK